MDCLDNDDASVLLLLSPYWIPWKGKPEVEGVGGALFGVGPLSPVKSNLLNASTSNGTLLPDVDELMETADSRIDWSD